MTPDDLPPNPRPVKRSKSENSVIDFVNNILSCSDSNNGESNSPPPDSSGEGDRSNTPDSSLGSTTPQPDTSRPFPELTAVIGSSSRGNFLTRLFWNPSAPPPSSNNNNNNDPEDRPDLTITFASCGGLDEQIDYIKKYVLRIMENQHQFESWGIDPVKGIIFHGPPGSGKTQLAKALANELKTIDGRRFRFFMRNGSELFGKYVGETEGRIRELFESANRNAPSVIFIDELDSICTSRAKHDGNLSRFYAGVVNQLLGCMDAVVRGKVLVIGATNRIDTLDPAFRRPGRFDRALPFHLPNASARTTILKIHSRRWRNHPSDADYDDVASRTVGYTGADLEHLCRETIIKSLNRQFPNYTPGQPLDLSRLRVALNDWRDALAGMTRTNTNVFGLAHFSGELAPPQVRLLTIGNENDIGVKIRPWLAELTRQDLGSSINSCLVWSKHRASLDIVNSYVIPSLVSTLDPTEVVAYRMNIMDLTSPSACYQFMAKVLDTTKTKLLIIPHLDDLMDIAIRHGVWFPLTMELSRLRGTRVLLLATASAPVDDIRSSEVQSLLSTTEEVKVRNLTTAEAKAYFEPLFTLDFYRDTQRQYSSNTTQGTVTEYNPATIRLLTKGLSTLLAKTTDFAHRHQISDALDMKNSLRRAITCELTPAQHLAALKDTLSDFRSSGQSTLYT